MPITISEQQKDRGRGQNGVCWGCCRRGGLGGVPHHKGQQKRGANLDGGGPRNPHPPHQHSRRHACYTRQGLGGVLLCVTDEFAQDISVLSLQWPVSVYLFPNKKCFLFNNNRYCFAPGELDPEPI